MVEKGSGDGVNRTTGDAPDGGIHAPARFNFRINKRTRGAQWQCGVGGGGTRATRH